MNGKRTPEAYRMIRRKRRSNDQVDLPPQHKTGPEADSVLSNPALSHITAQQLRHDTISEMQNSNGNQHTQQVLSRAATTTNPPQVKDTDFGTFLIGPTEKAVPLKQVQDLKKEWPLTQRVFDRVMKVIDILKGGSTEFEFKGSAAFQVALLLDLDSVLQKSSGRDLLTELAKAGNKLKIEYSPDATELQAVSESSTKIQPDGNPGSGSNLEMRYQASIWWPSTGDKGFEQRKPADDLAKLLVEALPMLAGTSPSDKQRDPQTEGLQATGFDKIAEKIRIENRFRAAFGLPLRPEE
jgi:hypothetical protein